MSTASFPYDLPTDGMPFVSPVDGIKFIPDTGASAANDTRRFDFVSRSKQKVALAMTGSISNPTFAA